MNRLRRIGLLLLTLALALSVHDAPAQVLTPGDDPDAGTVRSGRGWMVKPPGSGADSLKQISSDKPAVNVGDSANNHGWCYLMGFVIDEAFVTAANTEGSKLTLTVRSDKPLNGGAPSPVKLFLLDAAGEARQFSVYRAYNNAPHRTAIEGEIAPDAADHEQVFDVTEALTKAGGAAAGRVVYFALYCDPMTDGDDAGEALWIHSAGKHQPTLRAEAPAAIN